jgi:hypothetical protein
MSVLFSTRGGFCIGSSTRGRLGEAEVSLFVLSGECCTDSTVLYDSALEE